ncbi:MAG: YeeE/YedE thiosulfate transporter family protein [Pseudomonadota bacterium]
METEFTPIASLLGGMMIGASAIWLLLSTGRIAGISGIVSRLLPPGSSGVSTSISFVVGLLLAAPIYWLVAGMPAIQVPGSAATVVIAGLLVGLGSVIGAGCTSGHGVCGISRLSARSIVATITFMTAGFITVYLLRHVGGA